MGLHFKLVYHPIPAKKDYVDEPPGLRWRVWYLAPWGLFLHGVLVIAIIWCFVTVISPTVTSIYEVRLMLDFELFPPPPDDLPFASFNVLSDAMDRYMASLKALFTRSFQNFYFTNPDSPVLFRIHYRNGSTATSLLIDMDPDYFAHLEYFEIVSDFMLMTLSPPTDGCTQWHSSFKVTVLHGSYLVKLSPELSHSQCPTTVVDVAPDIIHSRQPAAAAPNSTSKAAPKKPAAERLAEAFAAAPRNAGRISRRRRNSAPEKSSVGRDINKTNVERPPPHKRSKIAERRIKKSWRDDVKQSSHNTSAAWGELSFSGPARINLNGTRLLYQKPDSVVPTFIRSDLDLYEPMMKFGLLLFAAATVHFFLMLVSMIRTCVYHSSLMQTDPSYAGLDPYEKFHSVFGFWLVITLLSSPVVIAGSISILRDLTEFTQFPSRVTVILFGFSSLLVLVTAMRYLHYFAGIYSVIWMFRQALVPLIIVTVGIAPIVASMMFVGIFLFGLISRVAESMLRTFESVLSTTFGDMIYRMYQSFRDGTRIYDALGFVYVTIVVVIAMWVLFTAFAAQMVMIYEKHVFGLADEK
jgi:hypothetical protein